MNTLFLDAIPLWLAIVVVAVLLGSAIEGGYRLGRWRHAHRRDEKGGPVGAMVASVLGLLALVLGFTFSLAASRFDARRMAVLEEANAIGTTYLRAQMLEVPERMEVSRLLREYVEVRIAGAKASQVEAAMEKSEKLHGLLWSQATAAAKKAPNSLPTALFIQSLNQVIDLHAERVLMGMRSRIPLVVWVMLMCLATLGVLSVGYQAALTETRRSPAMLGLVLAFASVMYLIADLDRGHEGLLQVSQQAMIDLQSTLSVELNPPDAD